MGQLVQPRQALDHGRGQHRAAPDLIGAVGLEPALEARILDADPLDAGAGGGDQVAEQATVAGHEGEAGAGALQLEAADHAGEHLEPLRVVEPQLGQHERDALALARQHVVDAGAGERLGEPGGAEQAELAGRAAERRRGLALARRAVDVAQIRPPGDQGVEQGARHVAAPEPEHDRDRDQRDQAREQHRPADRLGGLAALTVPHRQRPADRGDNQAGDGAAQRPAPPLLQRLDRDGQPARPGSRSSTLGAARVSAGVSKNGRPRTPARPAMIPPGKICIALLRSPTAEL